MNIKISQKILYIQIFLQHLIIGANLKGLRVYIFAMVCRVEWMKEYQGMIALAGNQVWWTWEVEDVFHKAKKGGKTAMKVNL